MYIDSISAREIDKLHEWTPPVRHPAISPKSSYAQEGGKQARLQE